MVRRSHCWSLSEGATAGVHCKFASTWVCVAVCLRNLAEMKYCIHQTQSIKLTINVSIHQQYLRRMVDILMLAEYRIMRSHL